MGLIRFLRRQFSGTETRSEPAPPSVAAASPPAPAVPDIIVPAYPRPNGLAAPPSYGVQRTGRPAGEAILHFAEARDARLATFAEPEVRREILRLHETIDQLHRQRRRLREERDRWERLARELERELLALRRDGPRDAANPLIGADKFRQAKIVLARLTHPDANGATGTEAGIRATVFREFWAEFERIEAEASAKRTRLAGR